MLTHICITIVSYWEWYHFKRFTWRKCSMYCLFIMYM